MIEFGNPQDMVCESEAVRLMAHVEGKSILCRVSREALEDLDGVASYSPEELLTAAQQHFDKLTDAWGQKIAAGRFEPDGGVLLRSDNFKG